MTRIKLKDNGGYSQLVGAKGVTVFAEKFLGSWLVKGEDLKELGCTGVYMREYAFLPREVEVQRNGFC